MTTESTSERQDSRAVQFAVVGSPSNNTHITLDIFSSHSESRLVGALVGFTSHQSEPLTSGDDEDAQQNPRTAVLGQITSLEMRNRWHEDLAFKNIIKSQATLPAITGEQDTRTALMKVGGCFVQNPGRDSYQHGDLGSVPPTGLGSISCAKSFWITC